jgi:hypothetical protein
MPKPNVHGPFWKGRLLRNDEIEPGLAGLRLLLEPLGLVLELIVPDDSLVEAFE